MKQSSRIVDLGEDTKAREVEVKVTESVENDEADV